MRRLELLVPFIVTLSVGATGCARARIEPRPKPLPAADQGQVAMQFLLDPEVPAPRLGDHQEFVTPTLMQGEMVLPGFPAQALKARAAPAHVVVRIIIDEQGRIADVRDSPVQASSDGPFAGVYRDAVLRALRHWWFRPGMIRHWKEGKDYDRDGAPDSREILRSDTVRVFYDVRFDFEIVDGEGRVRSSASPGS